MERFLDFAIFGLGALIALFGLLLLLGPVNNRLVVYEAQRLQERGSVFKRRIQGLILLGIGLALFVTAFVFQNRGNALAPAEIEPTVPFVETPATEVPQATIQPTPTVEPTLAPVEIVVQPSENSDQGEAQEDAQDETQDQDNVLVEQPTEVPAQAVVLEATPSPTAIPYDALVNVVGGLNMRDSPNGRVTVLLLNGTGMFMLNEAIAAGDYLWQKVESANGEEGWVAEDFIEYTSQP